jgi:hypothetical protein
MAAHFFGDAGAAACARFPSNWGKAQIASLHDRLGACADPVEIVLTPLGRIGQSGALFAGGLNRMLDNMFHVDCVAQSDTLIVQLIKRFDLLQLLDIRVQRIQYPVPPREVTCPGSRLDLSVPPISPGSIAAQGPADRSFPQRSPDPLRHRLSSRSPSSTLFFKGP